MPASAPPPPRAAADGSFVVRFGTAVGLGAVAALAGAVPATLRVASVATEGPGAARVWLALAAAALVPMVVAVVVLRGAREGLRAFGGPGAGLRASGSGCGSPRCSSGSRSSAASSARTTHHHALAGVTFAFGALAFALGVRRGLRAHRRPRARRCPSSRAAASCSSLGTARPPRPRLRGPALRARGLAATPARTARPAPWSTSWPSRSPRSSRPTGRSSRVARSRSSGRPLRSSSPCWASRRCATLRVRDAIGDSAPAFVPVVESPVQPLTSWRCARAMARRRRHRSEEKTTCGAWLWRWGLCWRRSRRPRSARAQDPAPPAVTAAATGLPRRRGAARPPRSRTGWRSSRWRGAPTPPGPSRRRSTARPRCARRRSTRPHARVLCGEPAAAGAPAGRARPRRHRRRRQGRGRAVPHAPRRDRATTERPRPRRRARRRRGSRPPASSSPRRAPSMRRRTRPTRGRLVAWAAAARSLARAFGAAGVRAGRRPRRAAAGDPRGAALSPAPPKSKAFYESGWFWGALGAAAFAGGAIFFATRDNGARRSIFRCRCLTEWPLALARLLALVATLLALAWAAPARAEPDEAAGPSRPRDVGVVVQPAAAKLPAAPEDFERIDDGWLVLEFPRACASGSRRSRGDADDFRTRLAIDLGAARARPRARSRRPQPRPDGGAGARGSSAVRVRGRGWPTRRCTSSSSRSQAPRHVGGARPGGAAAPRAHAHGAGATRWPATTCRAGSTRASPSTSRASLRASASDVLWDATLSQACCRWRRPRPRLPGRGHRGERRLRRVGRRGALPHARRRPRALRVARAAGARAARRSTARSRTPTTRTCASSSTSGARTRATASASCRCSPAAARCGRSSRASRWRRG